MVPHTHTHTHTHTTKQQCVCVCVCLYACVCYPNKEMACFFRSVSTDAHISCNVLAAFKFSLVPVTHLRTHTHTHTHTLTHTHTHTHTMLWGCGLISV